MHPKRKPLSSHAIYHKQDQNLMKNKIVTKELKNMEGSHFQAV